MLSEDEKQAIEKLKKIREDTIKANECGLSNNDFKEEIEVYDVISNLITKLQKENEEKDKQIDLMAELVYKRFKAELLLEYGFENEDQLKQYFAGLVEKE